jgi:predicted CXXCH cytochrome family protein
VSRTFIVPRPKSAAPSRAPWARALATALAGFAVLAAFAAGGGLLAQSNEDCLECHAGRDLEGTRAGKPLSVHVDAGLLRGSVHRDLDCVNCHQDLAGAELPHAEEAAPVACASCHEQPGADHAGSLHGRAAARGDPLAPSCATCHGSHAVRARTDPASPVAVMNVPFLCGRCHREGSPVSLGREIPEDRILENYSESIHGHGLFAQGLTVTAVCTSCHTAHRILPHTDPESSIHKRNVGTTCSKCHAQIEKVHRKVVEGRLWQEEPDKIPACVDCHSPHRIRQVFYPAGMANKDCLTCHGREDLATTRDGRTVPLHVDEEAYAASAHAGTACAQCHTEVQASLTRACETIRSKVDCAVCHAEQVGQYRGSTHGRLAAEGDRDAPACLDCHSKHATQSRRLPSSPTFPRNVPMLCAKCHRAGEKAAVRIHAEVTDIVRSYMDSIHGKGLVESGLVVTATCADCHTAHGELPPSDPNSTVNGSHIAGTCGRCHHGIEEQFRRSIHWPADAAGGKERPTCEDCHSSHAISRTDRPDFRFRMMDQCGRCHVKEAETFFDTFHGKVSRLGSSGAAKCYDCHGTHNILPPVEPASTLSRENVVATCGACHPGSHRRFAGYLTHATHHDPDKYPWLFWSFWGMTALLVGTLTFSLLHTLFWLVRIWLTRDQWRAHKALREAGGGKLYRRFDPFQRSLHLVMVISFFTLATTGMALKFSYTGWAQGFAWLLGGFETTGFLHRLGAITLGVILFLHLWDLRRRKIRAGVSWRRMIAGSDSILFNVTDLKELLGSIRWFFGVGPRPRYGRYSYWEKFDYFAVGWGILVIGSTGLVLWFPEFFTRVVPGWSVNVATIIHSDEALLAVAFIFTIHFFNTHFRPDKFPMDPVIFTGRMTLEELKYDKPREYEELAASGRLEAGLVDPFPKPVERAFRILGFAFLGVGLTLVVLIVYAMLAGYR